MSKRITSSQIEMPAHMGICPKALPIYKLDHPSLKGEDPRVVWEMRLKLLQEAFAFNGTLEDGGDRLVLQDKDANRVVQIYKASDSFLYYDRRLVTPNDEKFAANLLDYDSAKTNAHDWLTKFGLLNEHTHFEGMAYTGVSNIQVSDNPDKPGYSGGKEFYTEIKPCFGFKLNETPVLGPGAKIMLSYAGKQMSQAVYFWRRPVITSDGELRTLTPDTIKKHMARDPRFKHLESKNSKIRINTIKLGYYAASPADFQAYYLPVYQFTGIVETRGGHNAQGYEAYTKKKGSFVKETLQYNFNYFLPACSLSLQQRKLSGFPAPIDGSAIF